MDESEFRSNPPRPGDKVWLAPVVFERAGNGWWLCTDPYGNARSYDPADIDRIERAPRAPGVGDRVRVPGWSTPFCVVHVNDGLAWIKNTPKEPDLAPTELLRPLDHIQVIEP